MSRPRLRGDSPSCGWYSAPSNARLRIAPAVRSSSSSCTETSLPRSSSLSSDAGAPLLSSATKSQPRSLRPPPLRAHALVHAQAPDACHPGRRMPRSLRPAAAPTCSSTSTASTSACARPGSCSSSEDDHPSDHRQRRPLVGAARGGPEPHRSLRGRRRPLQHVYQFAHSILYKFGLKIRLDSIARLSGSASGLVIRPAWR